jgi:hypothetical protein
MQLAIVLFALGMPEIILIALVTILPILGLYRLFIKANKSGWAAFIPVYNILVFLDIIGKPWWWIFLFIIPFLNVIWIIWAWFLVCRSFAKSDLFIILSLLLGIVIFIPILGFSNSKYIGPAGLK